MIRLRTLRGIAVSVLLAGLLVVVSATVLTKVALAIFFAPSSIDTTGLVSPAFGSAVAVITTEYDAFGVHFSDAGVDTGIFDDGDVLAWSGINASGDVDLIAPVQGKIVVPGTGGVQGQTSSLSVEGGFAEVGNLLLEVFDCDGSLIGSTINDDGTGPNGRGLMALAIPGIASFRVSTPAPGGFADEFGVNSIDMGEPVPCPTTITLAPPSDTNTVGDDHAVTATLDIGGDPLEGVEVQFEVIDGPNAGEVSDPGTGECSVNDDCTSDGAGTVSWTYTGDGVAGTDTIEACFFDEELERDVCDTATKEWVEPAPTPTPTATGTPEPTATATPAPTPTVAAAVQLPTTGGTPSDGGSGGLAWLAAIAGAIALIGSGSAWFAYQRRRVR